MGEFSIIYSNGDVKNFKASNELAIQRARKQSKFDSKLTLWILLENRAVRMINW